MTLSDRLWVREDGEQPKAIPGDGSLPPGPGLVVDVAARSSEEARQVYGLAAAEDVNEAKDADGWNEQRKARRRVSTPIRVARGTDGRVTASAMDALRKKKGGDA